MAEETKKAPAKAAPKTTALIWKHDRAEPGTEKKLFGILCVANDDGFFCCKVPAARAKLELKRANHWKFQRLEDE